LSYLHIFTEGNNEVLDDEASKNLFNHIHKIWMEPEILRRKKTGSLPDDFQIFHCLIRLPKERPPVVEFNDEISWIASVKKAPGTSFEKGQAVFIHEIKEISAVKPPEVDGQRVAFIYLSWMGYGYQIFFDFTPNLPESTAPKVVEMPWGLGEKIAQSLQIILTEKTIHIHDIAQKKLQKIGLWACPALLPYPLSKILWQLGKNDVDGARATLLSYCSPEYIENLSSKWWNIEQFKIRKSLIQDAIAAHKEGKYGLSIHALLPQIEGIVTDYVSAKLPVEEIPWRQESKTRKFRDLVLGKPMTMFTYKRIVESTIDFILGGPVLETFKRWVDQINDAFPNRHVVQHGKYDEKLFTEENSVKLLLLLDTLYYILSAL
jgi:hypothetical protein